MPQRILPAASALSAALLLLIAAAASAQPDIEKHGSCRYCGMDRQMFAPSRMLVVYDDGSELGACSLHCVAIDLAVHIDKTPRSILVADFNGKHLIDAEKAFWVLGGDKPGVMSRRAKWAFEKRSDAEAFMAAHGGALTDFDGALTAAYEDMNADTKMIRERRKAKRMKSGS